MSKDFTDLVFTGGLSIKDLPVGHYSGRIVLINKDKVDDTLFLRIHIELDIGGDFVVSYVIPPDGVLTSELALGRLVERFTHERIVRGVKYDLARLLHGAVVGFKIVKNGLFEKVVDKDSLKPFTRLSEEEVVSEEPVSRDDLPVEKGNSASETRVVEDEVVGGE